MKNISTWQVTGDQTAYPVLKQDLDVDVLIVGGGITGLTSAYLLANYDKKVALIEKGIIGRDSATSWTTAFITQVSDTDLTTIADIYDRKTAKLVWEAGQAAVDFIAKTVAKEKIDCEFSRCDNIDFAIREKDEEQIKTEAEFAKKLGFNVEFLPDANFGFKGFGYMVVKNQAKFHPVKYIQMLAQIASKKGVEIYENTEAVKLSENDTTSVETENGIIRAKTVILATHSPFNAPFETYFKAGEYKTYMLEVRLPKNTIEENTYQDSNAPYYYFRIDKFKTFDRMILGGADHRSDIPFSEKKGFEALEKYLKNLLPTVEYKIIKRWSGPILEAIDGLPYIGSYKKKSNVLVTHGFSGTGMTFGTVSAMIFRDIVLKRKNPWISTFDATRLPTLKRLFAKGIDYSQELIGGVIKNSLT